MEQSDLLANDGVFGAVIACYCAVANVGPILDSYYTAVDNELALKTHVYTSSDDAFNVYGYSIQFVMSYRYPSALVSSVTASSWNSKCSCMW